VVGIGDILASKYRVERILGHGGMGYLLAGRHEQLEQQVAIKILTPELCGSEKGVARFLRRARASVPFQSEHVARVLDVGTLDDGVPYMVMEFLEGCDLAHELDERVLLPAGEAVDYVLQTCEALAEAHTLGIVHGDLKPANLFRTRRPDGSALIKVLGFGISEASPTNDPGKSHPSGRSTPSGVPPLRVFHPFGCSAAARSGSQRLEAAPAGDDASSALMHLTAGRESSSLYYMSPEQVHSPETVDARSDVWSLGIVLCELLTGYPPRALDTPPILADVAADMPRERDGPSTGLQDVIRRCLERDASQRYADVIELADALQIYTPNGAAAVARIFATVRSVKARSRGEPSPRPAWEGPTLESRATPPTDTPTLESPRQRSKVLDGGKHSSVARGHSRSPLGRSRWIAVLIGATATLGALSLQTYLARSRSADSYRAASAAPSFTSPTARIGGSAIERAATSRDPVGAIDPAASEVPPVAAKRGASKKNSPTKAPAASSVIPPKTATPSSLPLDNAPDPLDGRF